ncbi:uncharacterized protein F4807DRAFT_107402 [Annulohypoxylon truncatum]|uniref:uncharacterized protein n=1 Tax=Annulohypoxylon truncatum TaxID=327061 RepID=UPI0020085B3F|nr:uncharacterized protein F4807DRAFT_107402 [Annulohypoxylon truncatum]KAI1209014.1 hypothetical protein F4807DRAFT_107402 [Annulohypoxylon truncatum]
MSSVYRFAYRWLFIGLLSESRCSARLKNYETRSLIINEILRKVGLNSYLFGRFKDSIGASKGGSKVLDLRDCVQRCMTSVNESRSQDIEY